MLVTPTLIIPGTEVNAVSVNTPVNQLANAINNNIAALDNIAPAVLQLQNIVNGNISAANISAHSITAACLEQPILTADDEEAAEALSAANPTALVFFPEED